MPVLDIDEAFAVHEPWLEVDALPRRRIGADAIAKRFLHRFPVHLEIVIALQEGDRVARRDELPERSEHIEMTLFGARELEEDAILGVFCRRWGVPLVDGGTVRLPRLIGMSRSLDLILTGRPVDAREAEHIGLANRVVPRGQSRPAAEAGRVSRPVLRVTSASLSPLPSSHSRFDAGTRTFVKRSTPFSIPLSPMNDSRCTTSTPGQSASTTNALMRFPVRAITTMTPATGPLVHHSFSPFRR